MPSPKLYLDANNNRNFWRHIFQLFFFDLSLLTGKGFILGNSMPAKSHSLTATHAVTEFCLLQKRMAYS